MNKVKSLLVALLSLSLVSGTSLSRVDTYQNRTNVLMQEERNDFDNGIVDYTKKKFQFSLDDVKTTEQNGYVYNKDIKNPFSISTSGYGIEGNNDSLAHSHNSRSMNFNDDGEMSNKNEAKYSELLRIYFPPNVDYVDFDSLTLRVKDVHRHTNWIGTDDLKSEEKQVVMSRLTTFDEDNGVTSSASESRTEYEDVVYNCEYGQNEWSKTRHGFRVVYENNELGTSDEIVIYNDANQNGSDHGDSINGGHGHIGSRYTGKNGNNDYIKNNGFIFSGKLHFDTPKVVDFELNNDQIITSATDYVNQPAKRYYWDNGWVTVENKNSNFDKLDNHFNNLTYEGLMNELWGLHGDFINSYFKSLETNDSKLSRKVKESDFQVEFNNNNKTYNLTDFKDSSSGKTPINSSKINIKFSIDESKIDELYKDKNLYDIEDMDRDYGFTSDIEKEFSMNLPFYNWIFEEIPPLDKEYHNIFKQDTNFFIDRGKFNNSWYNNDYEINIYTNSNIKFKIDNDPNVSSVSYNGLNVPHINGETNSFEFTTDFDDIDENSTKEQRSSATIKYANKVTNDDSVDPVNQKVKLNFIYDSDSVLENSNENQVHENIGDNEKTINSEILKWSNDKEDLLMKHNNSSEFNITDYYKVSKNMKINFTNDEINFIKTKNNILPIERYYSDSSGTIKKEDMDDFELSNETIISNNGIYKIPLELNTRITYNYWISVSDQYIDYGIDDGIEGNNFIPREFKPSIDSGEILYDDIDGVTSFNYTNENGNEETYYLKKFFNTEDGKDLYEKGVKKGWTNAELRKEESYSISVLFDNWDKLKDFNLLKIDTDELSNLTSEYQQKKRYKFKDFQDIFISEINKQLTSTDPLTGNSLRKSDYKISFYNEDWEPMSLTKNIKNDDLINVKISSTRYGSGTGEYKFGFYTNMIEPMPVIYKLLIGMVSSIVVITTSLIIVGLYKRQKNKKIKV